jgi:hypothetical protein
LNTLLKFDGPQLEALLEQVQRELGSEVTIVEANRTRRGGIGGFFAREWFEVVVDPGGAVPSRGPAAASAGADLGAEAPAGGEVDPFLALAAAVDDVREAAPTTTATAPPPGFELALAAAQRGTGLAVVPTAAPAVPAPAPPIPAPATCRMRDLDLPTLLAHLDALVPPVLVPSGSAATVAVVGDHHSVHGVASALAVRLGLDESDVIVASPEPQEGMPVWLRLHTPDDVLARADRWRRSSAPRVVAVELAPGREGHAWAASMLGVIGADQVRLVAKAWQLTDQLAAKAAVLGGIDGLDLVEMEAAAEPELFLELDLDVLGIDGRPATAELWAALLYERRHDGNHQ